MNNGGSGWETVVSSKASKGNGGKDSKDKTKAANAAKKKFVERAPRLEDVLPMDQVNAIYNAEPSMRPQPPASPGKPAAEFTSSPGKGQKAASKKAKKAKAGDSAASSKPKTLTAAIKEFKVNDFKAALVQTRTFYATNPAMWIKEAAGYLNECLVAEEAAVDYANHFTSKPMSLVTKELKRTLVQILEECGDAGRQGGYELLVANLGHDLAKASMASSGSGSGSVGVNGSLVLIQILAESYPHLALTNNKRFGELIHSYQNKASVCIPVLWALGQSGRKDLAVGLKVWIEFMRPLLRFKNYSKHVVSYLSQIWDEHNQTPSGGGRLIYSTQFFSIIDALFQESAHLNKELQKEIVSVYPAVKAVSIGDCSIDHELFPEFLRRLSDWYFLENRSEDYRSILTDCMAECVANNPIAVVSHWQQMYRSHFVSSGYLLQQLGSNKKYTNQLVKSSQFRHHSDSFEELVEAFQEYNATCPSNKEGRSTAVSGCKNLISVICKMEEGSGSGGLPYKTMILLLAVGLGLVVNHDINKKGSFENSNTGLFLKDIGMYERTLDAYFYTLDTYDLGYAYAEFYVPFYYNKTRENLGPLIDKAATNANWAFQETKKMGPVVIDKANEYLPGAKDRINLFLSESGRLSNQALEWGIANGKLAAAYTAQTAQSASKSIQATVQDVIDGKIELKDVYNGAKDLGNQAILKFEQVRQSYAAAGAK